MLEIRSIDVYRGANHIVHNLSLVVGEAEVVCLVGRNGAGKTTTLETIMGYLVPRAGNICFRDQDVTRLPTHKRVACGLGYSPENCGIFTRLTVEENLSMSLWIGERLVRERADGAIRDPQNNAFEVFPELKDLLQRSGLHLSGGQRKMVAVARAIMLSPKVMLLDEAFEGLAPAVVARFTDAVVKIKEMGVSILMAESQFGAATRIADRMYAIDRGETIFEGTPCEALSDSRVLQALRG